MNMGAVRIVIAAGLAAAVSLSPAFATPAADDLEGQARETWRETIVRASVPERGCFHASYPGNEWQRMECSVAPNVPYVPHSGAITLKVGDGVDYAAEVTGLMSASVGSFPTVTGVISEKEDGPSNYSLQLNSNFMSTAACDGISGCMAWEQFVYTSDYRRAFMQYWLINYGDICPSGWNSYSTDCYMNSAAVSAPKQVITQLENLKLSGSAVENGIDTLVFTTETDAYSTTGEDSVVDLATDWQASEFNVIGDGGGSNAVFNKGSSITVNIEVTDGSKKKPSCGGRHAGTTGETNNLILGPCTASAGSTPSIEFTESN
jgi:hypothetical protein